jgi:wyosine [tRNA(Phe)-imidazoG37] synthetase (radical SAM superfamily)
VVADSGLIPAHLDHSRDWRGFRYCYPVVSRRSRGLSLGVNINPGGGCNFDCVYCEVGRPRGGTDAIDAIDAIDLDRLEREMSALLDLAASGELPARLNDMAFSGDGEPTAAPSFPAAVSRLAGLRRVRGLGDVKIVLITNSTMLRETSVVGGIDEMMESGGEIWAKLDSGTEARHRAISRSAVPLGDVLENLAFAGRRWPLVIQTMLLEWDGAAPARDEVDAYLGRLRGLLDAGIELRGLHLYTVARPTPEPAARPLPKAALDEIAGYIAAGLPGAAVDVFYGPVA